MVQEAKECVDEITEPESATNSNNKTRYRIDYYNSVKNYVCTYVNAYSEAEARLIVQKVFGDEIWKIDRVVPLN